MSDYKSYCLDVIADSVPMLIDHRDYVLELIEFLFNENVIVSYVWMLVSGYPHLAMHAIVEDENEDEYECVARWEYDHSRTSDPFGPHYELVDVELTDLPGGMK